MVGAAVGAAGRLTGWMTAGNRGALDRSAGVWARSSVSSPGPCAGCIGAAVCSADATDRGSDCGWLVEEAGLKMYQAIAAANTPTAANTRVGFDFEFCRCIVMLKYRELPIVSGFRCGQVK